MNLFEGHRYAVLKANLEMTKTKINHNNIAMFSVLREDFDTGMCAGKW
jgi:hypothetical protein